MLAAQHRKLVAQHQYLKLLAPADSTARSAPGCGAAPGRRRPDHTRPPPTKASGATTHRSPPSSRTCWSPPRPTSGTPRAPSALTDVDKAVGQNALLRPYGPDRAAETQVGTAVGRSLLAQRKSEGSRVALRCESDACRCPRASPDAPDHVGGCLGSHPRGGDPPSPEP